MMYWLIITVLINYDKILARTISRKLWVIWALGFAGWGGERTKRVNEAKNTLGIITHYSHELR